MYEINFNEDFWGTHAYIVKNANIPKIYQCLLNVDDVMDWKYRNAIKSNELNGWVVYPILVDQNGSESIIGQH
jgi:hypothetical protein